ncbi:MAG: nucleotidyl transferase AbiEii/AbiGii toxin family protein [Actinobacteria bacterium]|nr:nucleotidyl transferase AbiEii/AbiGii toxin family protein [Actinomycetota bacterium]MCL5744203.1 nucleotidyl transferase AbiEii/AbiGii toxin family protein [Acidobacteriota bacterium]
MKKRIRDVAASHPAKLLALARTRGDDFQFLLGRWIIERFLYRLAGSNHTDGFVLKGAMLFLAWGSKPYRPTRDLDLLGFGSASLADIADRIREICSVTADDSIVFDVAGIEAERIKEDAEYEGVRVPVPATLDGARVTMQIDDGFGEVVDPSPVELLFPTLLLLDAPVIRAYPPEAVIAEKFQAMVALGIANSRLKDFFDMWTFALTQHFDAARLSQSIRRSFEQRRTGLPATPPVALTGEFLLDTVKGTPWAAFCKRLGLRDPPALDAVGPVLLRFLMPMVEPARQQEPDALIWEAPGPWRKAGRVVE